jgi:hypothetical protein
LVEVGIYISHSTNTASFFAILMAALIFSLSLAGVAAAQGNTSLGTGALQNNTTGSFNTASGVQALFSSTTGFNNAASGAGALQNNTTGTFNTAIGVGALVNNTTGRFNGAVGNEALLATPRAATTPPSGTQRSVATKSDDDDRRHFNGDQMKVFLTGASGDKRWARSYTYLNAEQSSC